MTDRLEEVLEQFEEEREDQEVLTLGRFALPVLDRPETDPEHPAALGGARSDGAAAFPKAPRQAEEAAGDLQAVQRSEGIAGGQRGLWPEEGAGRARGEGGREETWLAANAASQARSDILRPDEESRSDSLFELYRRVRRAVGAAWTSPAVPQMVTVTERRTSPAAGLTAGELDRAVRRDSRRYDGGMTVY